MSTHAQTQELSFSNRILGVLKLNRTVYEEIGTTPTALPQAMMVVAAAAAANAVAETGEGGLGAPGGATTVLIGWLGFCVAAWVMAALFSKQENGIAIDRLLRIIGFAFAPVILLALSPVPILGTIATIVVAIYSLLVMVTAISVGLSTSTGKAVLTLIAAGVFAGFASLMILSALGMGTV